MDVGGLNGALLDPMSMTDAELLDVPSLPDIGDSLGDKLDDVASVLGQNTVMDSGRVAELEGQVATRDVQIGELNTQIAALKDDKAKLSEKVELFDDELTDLREQFNNVSSSNDQMTAKIQKLEELKVVNEERISSLEESSKNAVNNQELEAKVAEESDRANKLESKIKQMETDSAALTKRNQDLIGNKNQKISELNTAIAELKTSIAEKDSEKATHAEKVNEMQLSLDKRDEDIRNLQKTITDLKQCNDEMAEKEKEIADLKSKMDEMSLKKKIITEEKDKLETDNKLLNEKVSKTVEIAGNNENLQKEIDSLQGEVKLTKEKLELVEKNKAELKIMVDSLSDEKESLSSKVTDTAKLTEDLQKQLEEVNKSAKSLEAEKTDLSTRLANNEQKGLELTLVQTQLQETQKREAKLKADVAALTDKLTKVDAEKQLLSSEVTKAVTASRMFEEQLKTTALELETNKKHKLSLEQSVGNYTKLSHDKAAVEQRCSGMRM